MEGEHPPRARLGVGEIAEGGFGVGCDVFEAPLARVPKEIGRPGDVSYGTAAMWLMDGPTATFVGAVVPFNPGPSWQIKGTRDFDGDGKSDILWQGDDGTPAIWFMDGMNFMGGAAAGSFNPGMTGTSSRDRTERGGLAALLGQCVQATGD